MHTTYSATRGRLLNVVGVSLLLLAAGCGGSRSTVSGKVFYKGKALPGGSVIFIHEKGSFSSQIQDDGSYRIDKIPTGPVKIAVTAPSGTSGGKGAMPTGPQAEKLKKEREEVKSEEKGPKEMMAEMMGPQGAQGKKPTITLPSKYGDPEKSGLQYTVGNGPQTYDIKLE